MMPLVREEPVIRVEALHKRYGDVPAVQGISFDVQRGQVFAFLGPNGAGKTSTVEIIETIRRPTAGTVRVLGLDVQHSKRDVVQRIGVLPQEFATFQRLSVCESLHYYARLFGVRPDIESLIALTHLEAKRDEPFHALSGGLKQRLGIAIALINDPEIVFLDEPSAGLDPQARRTVWTIIEQLKRNGKTVFLTTHYIEEAEALADEVAIMSKGRIVAQGSPQQLIREHSSATHLILKETNAPTMRAVEQMGFDVAMDETGQAAVRVDDTDQVLIILAGLKAAGLSLPTIELRYPRLEEVFLSMTSDLTHGMNEAGQVLP